MKITELIATLQRVVDIHGDRDVHIIAPATPHNAKWPYVKAPPLVLVPADGPLHVDLQIEMECEKQTDVGYGWVTTPAAVDPRTREACPAFVAAESFSKP